MGSFRKSPPAGMLLAALMFSPAAPLSAASGQLSFTGAVTETTCDVYMEVNGVRGNVVSLGTVSPDAATADDLNIVSFALKPDLRSPGCGGLGRHGRVTVTWQGDFSSPQNPLGIAGMLAAQAGEATDAGVLITTVNPGIPSTLISAGSTKSGIDGETFLKEGMMYVTALIPGRERGTFSAAAAFVVVYD